MAEHYSLRTLIALQNLDRIKIGVERELLLEHVKTCIGCPDCLPYLPTIRARKRILEDTKVGGKSMAEALELRRTHSIYAYYPHGDEFRLPSGELDKDVYLKLKNVDGPDGKGFTDAEIWEYFHINQGESQRFKAKYFGSWIGGKEDYIFEEGLDAIKKYDEKYGKRKVTSRVKHTN